MCGRSFFPILFSLSLAFSLLFTFFHRSARIASLAPFAVLTNIHANILVYLCPNPRKRREKVWKFTLRSIWFSRRKKRWALRGSSSAWRLGMEPSGRPACSFPTPATPSPLWVSCFVSFQFGWNFTWHVISFFSSWGMFDVIAEYILVIFKVFLPQYSPIFNII